MANVMDYLDWRGDLSFAADPFNEVDNFICSQMVSPDLSLLVPESGEGCTLAEAMERYGTLWGERGDRLGVLQSPHVLPMLRKAAAGRRFSHTRLCRFVNLCDDEETEQFSAVTLRLEDGSCYIAYKGTDDSLTGWKEDFLMTVRDTVPAQEDALRYLIAAAEETDAPLRLGGHSKGGNLAMYAAIHAPEEIQKRIINVYNNDGPGFRGSVRDTPGYERIAERMLTILPQHSIVGTLLESAGEKLIINSDHSAPESHDGFTWQVLGGAFLRCEDFSRNSRTLNEALDNAIDAMDTAERSAFVEALFEVLTSTGARTLTELSGQGLRQAVDMLRQSRKNPEVLSFLTTLLEQLVKEYAEDVKERVPSLPEPRWPFHRKNGDEAENAEGEEPADAASDEPAGEQTEETGEEKPAHGGHYRLFRRKGGDEAEDGLKEDEAPGAETSEAETPESEAENEEKPAAIHRWPFLRRSGEGSKEDESADAASGEPADELTGGIAPENNEEKPPRSTRLYRFRRKSGAAPGSGGEKKDGETVLPPEAGEERAAAEP